MNKIVVTFLMALLIGGNAYAQSGKSTGVGGGLSLAGLTSQIDGDQWGGYNKFGYHLGGFAYYDFNDWASLQIEILLGHRGSRETRTAIGQVALNYIDVPVLFRIRPLRDHRLEPYAELGPSVSYLLSARTGFKPSKLDQTDNYRRITGEFHIGAGMQANPYLGLFARWSVGFSNLTVFYPPWFTIHYISLGVKVGLK